uniref:hypothetical protein n=1 Tax=Shewanella algae TaxID=38313 RepID=UPI000B340F01
MGKPSVVEGIFDTASSILTIGSTKTCAFKVADTVANLSCDERLHRLTSWARNKNLIKPNAVIAEI